MKNFYSLFLALCFFSTAAFCQQHFNGNNKAGFNGAVGQGSLDVYNDNTNIYFQFNRAAGPSQIMNNPLVIYIDNTPGGYSTTANFTDAADGLRKAISGYTDTDNGGGPGRSAFNFNNDFTPEYGLAFYPGVGSSLLVALQENTSHIFISNPNFTNKTNQAAANYIVTVPLSQLGLNSSNINFKFIATYITATGYRSNEAIGDPMTGFGENWDHNYTSTTSPLDYTSVLPVVFGSFYGTLEGKAINLFWDVKTQTNTHYYQVQKSSDGNNYVTIATVPSKNGSFGASYTYTDHGSINLRNYYRIAAVDYDGHVSLSKNLLIQNIVKTQLLVIGNPSTNVINLQISNPNIITYQLLLYSASGQKLESVMYNHPGGISTKTMNVSKLQRGMYYLVALSAGEKQSINVLIQ